MNKSLTSIAIVGGGTAGWMAATLLSTLLRSTKVKVTVIESPDIPTIGVGESTVPSMVDFLKASHIDLKEFMQACSASFKLGIKFDDWLNKGESYFHPFGKIGKDINGFDFYQVWLKSLADGSKSAWLDYSPSANMAINERFILKPAQTQDWVLAGFAHAFHLDANKLANYLRKIATQRGIKRIEATVKDVMVDNTSFINHLVLDDASLQKADFYIDCTGFTGVLIEKALKVGYQDWSNLLPCDRAVTIQTENINKPVPYTIACAKESGWTWTIPLQHRTGNGYVYASQFCSDDLAIDTLLNSVKGNTCNEPRVIPFVTGRRDKIWHKNCLAIGLAGGFLEPLESTAIHLVYKTLVHFIQHFPDQDFDQQNETAFNQKINHDFEEVRDFLIMHYCTSQRSDSEFWRWCNTMEVPKSLTEKIEGFRLRGQLDHTFGQFFTSDSWCSILEGMKIRPVKFHPLIDAFDKDSLANILNKNRREIQDRVMQMPIHDDYIQAHCRAED